MLCSNIKTENYLLYLCLFEDNNIKLLDYILYFYQKFRFTFKYE